MNHIDLFRLIQRALRIDIFDLNYRQASETANMYARRHQLFPKSGILKRIASFFLHFIKSLIRLTRKRQPSTTPSEIIFFSTSLNQKEAMTPVMEKMKVFTFIDEDKPGQMPINFPLFWAYFLSIPFILLVIYHYIKATKYQRSTYTYALDVYWLSYGYYITSVIWLARLKPKALVVSNDHNMKNRVIAKAARELKIKTFYIQHASASHEFPPLSFDYALLDGMAALLKYDSIGKTPTKVYLTGIPKFDSTFSDINTNPQVRKIAICASMRDNVSEIDELHEHIAKHLPDLDITLRVHPSDRARLATWCELSVKKGMRFSDSRTINSFQFLKDIDAVIAGLSNILLEAALMDVYPIYYDFYKSKLDTYGFVENKLVEYFSEPEQVCEKLKQLSRHKPSIRMNTKTYCDTVGTPYDGHSAQLVSHMINALSHENTDLEAHWTRIPSIQTEAYQISAAMK